MKIDFTVTKRDKKLLAGLAVCAAVFCFYWFGVKPQMDCLDKLEMQQEALEMQQLQMQVHIAALPVDEKRDEEQKQQLAELESHFFPYQTNEELNRYLTDVFVSEGMIMQDSTLRAGQLDEITPYSLSERMALLKKNEQAKQTQTDTKGTELGWFVTIMPKTNKKDALELISMTEDVKKRGGSGYVVNKTKKILQEYLQ